MNLKNKLIPTIALAVLGLAFPVKALATPHFTLTPSSENEVVGTTFVVVVGVDSGAEKVIGIDIKAAFDATKLEIESIDKATIPDTGYQFTYTPTQPIIHNDTGTFEVTLPPSDSSVYTGVVAKQDLLRITFKPKASGAATMNYICTPGSITESNIINQSSTDVVDCTANQSGSYTIANSSNVVATVTPTPSTTVTPTTTGSVTPTITAKPTSSSSLPSTGAVGDTVLLMVVGISSMAAAAFLKLI